MIDIPNHKELNIDAIIKYLADLSKDNMFMISNNYSQDEYFLDVEGYKEHNIVYFKPVEGCERVEDFYFNLKEEEDKIKFIYFVFQELFVYHDVTYPTLWELCEQGAFHNDK